MNNTEKAVAWQGPRPATPDARLGQAGQSASAIAHEIDVAHVADLALHPKRCSNTKSSTSVPGIPGDIRRAVDEVSLDVGRLRDLDRPRDDPSGTGFTAAKRGLSPREVFASC